jgi:hypothetical protein
MKNIFKFFFVIILISTQLYAIESCILVFSTKVVYPTDKKFFISKFPNGIIKKYDKYYEFKLNSFESYQKASQELKIIKKYYKDAFIINCEKKVKEKSVVIVKSPIIREVSNKKYNKNIIKSISTISKIKNNKINPPIKLKEISLDSKKYHTLLIPEKISKANNKPEIEEPKVLKPYEIPKLRKIDKNQIYDTLSFKKYIKTLFEFNDNANEIFYQRRIDYILSEINKDRYNFDVYLQGYLRTGSSISAQSGNAPNVNGDYTGAGIALNANKILYDGGYKLINHTYDILYKRLADIKALNAKDRLVIIGTSIYINLYVSQEEIDVFNKIYKKQEIITNFVKEGYRKGKNSVLDYIDSKNDLLNLKRNLINLKSQYLHNDYILRHSTKSKSKKQFKLYMQKIDLNLDSFALLQKEAIANSGDIARESNNLKIAQTDLLFQKRRYLPEVDFDSYIGYGLSTNKVFDLSNPGKGAYWELGLNFKLPIYKRKDIRLNIEKERYRILKQKAIFSQKQRDVLIQVDKSYKNLMRIKKEKEILNEQLRLMSKKLKIAKERYMVGISAYRDYADTFKNYLAYKVELLKIEHKYNQEMSLLSIFVGKRDFYE